jgi:hypothetical protein
MDGLWSGAGASEPTQQADFIRHRLLCVNVSNIGFQNPIDASSYASVDPNLMFAAANWAPPQGGPHFVMSPETPDSSHSYGFEFALFVPVPVTLDNLIPLAGGLTVTWWELIGNTQMTDGLFIPTWASFASRTGVNFRELYHSFDVNPCALRLQITNVTQPIVDGGSVIIAFSEL